MSPELWCGLCRVHFRDGTWATHIGTSGHVSIANRQSAQALCAGGFVPVFADSVFLAAFGITPVHINTVCYIPASQAGIVNAAWKAEAGLTKMIAVLAKDYARHNEGQPLNETSIDERVQRLKALAVEFGWDAEIEKGLEK